MKRMNKFLLTAIILLILGGLMGLNYYLTTPSDDDDSHDKSAQVPNPMGRQMQPSQPSKKQPVVKKVKLYLISAHAQNFSLVAVSRGLTSTEPEDQVLETAELLCEGGQVEEQLDNPIPESVKVLGLTIENGVANINFSQNLIRNFPGGSEWEALSVSAIVKTLTQFSQVKSVQILVDGKKIDSIGGHVDISHPISRNEKIL